MANPLVATRDYFRHSIAELKKVSWPSRELTIRYSALVVIVSVVLAAFFAALDFGLSQGVTFALEHKPASTAPAPEAPVVPTTADTSGNNVQNGIEVTPETAPAAPATTAPVSGSAPITLPPIDPSKK